MSKPFVHNPNYGKLTAIEYSYFTTKPGRREPIPSTSDCLEEWLTNYEGFAQNFVEIAKGWGLKLDFSEEGLKPVDEFFQRKRDFRKKLSDGAFSVVWFSLAAYLSVVIKRKFRGEPTLDRNEGKIVFGNIPNSTAEFYPIDYTCKFFESPEENCLYAFHGALKVMIERRD